MAGFIPGRRGVTRATGRARRRSETGVLTGGSGFERPTRTLVEGNGESSRPTSIESIRSTDTVARHQVEIDREQHEHRYCHEDRDYATCKSRALHLSRRRDSRVGSAGFPVPAEPQYQDNADDCCEQ